MTKRIVLGAAFALVIVGLTAPSASAFCANSTTASTYNPVSYAYTFWHTSLTGPGRTLVGKLWTPGGQDVTGTCNVQTPTSNPFLYFGADPQNVGFSIDFANGCVGGTPGSPCPGAQLAVMATVSQGNKTEFLTTQVNQGSSGVNYDFSGLTSPPHNMVAIPRPRITSSSRVGSSVNAQVTIDPASLGAYDGSAGLITGYNILSKLSGTDPGRNASGYDAGPNVTAAGGGTASTGITVDCTGGSPSLNRRWVVTQLVTANGPSPTVSEATLVSCDGSLAEPPGKYKIVPKPKAAPNSKKN